jgi:hypothetical protein
MGSAVSRHGSAGASERREGPSRLLTTLLILTGLVVAAPRVEAASVAVTWTAPTTSTDGTRLTDLAGYRLYLGTSSPACPSGSFFAVPSPTPTPSAGQTVSQVVTALSAGVTYFARITAVDTSGNESPCSVSASGLATSDFTVTPSGTTSFGSVAVGATADRTFTVQNTSSTSISVTASVTAPFRVAAGASLSLASGASQSVTVRFQPTGAGTFAGNVTFTANGDSLSRGVSGSATGVASATLSVTKSGTGAGTVTGVPAGIACGTTCSQSVTAGTPVTLTAAAAAGSAFAGWGGACSGTTACTVVVNAATAVSATFNAGSTSQSPPGTPESPSVTQIAADASGVTFAIAWSAGSGATSYRYVAGFSDGSASQQGTVTSASFQLRMPYHASGGAASGFVCIQSVSAAGVASVDQSCGGFSVAARPAAPPSPTAGSLSPASAPAGSGGVTLTVNGSDFVSTSVVRWNGMAMTTTFVSASQLQAAIGSVDLAVAGSIPVSVVTPAPGGGTSGAVTFTITSSAPAPPPPAPGNPAVSRVIADASGATLTIAWSPASGATSYRWNAAFSDGSAAQQGTGATPSLQLRMPYHSSGAAFAGFICVGAVGPSGVQSVDQSCGALSVPARP